MKYTLKNKEIELTDKEVEEIVAKYTKKDKRWKPERGDTYWTVMNLGFIKHYSWGIGDDRSFEFLRKTANYFQTKEEAQAHLDRINAIATVTDYIYENDLQWKEGYRYVPYLYTDIGDIGEIRVDWFVEGICFQQVIPFLKTREACEQLIKHLPEDLKLIFK